MVLMVFVCFCTGTGFCCCFVAMPFYPKQEWEGNRMLLYFFLVVCAFGIPNAPSSGFAGLVIPSVVSNCVLPSIKSTVTFGNLTHSLLPGNNKIIQLSTTMRDHNVCSWPDRFKIPDLMRDVVRGIYITFINSFKHLSTQTCSHQVEASSATMSGSEWFTFVYAINRSLLWNWSAMIFWNKKENKMHQVSN